MASLTLITGLGPTEATIGTQSGPGTGREGRGWERFAPESSLATGHAQGGHLFTARLPVTNKKRKEQNKGTTDKEAAKKG